MKTNYSIRPSINSEFKFMDEVEKFSNEFESIIKGCCSDKYKYKGKVYNELDGGIKNEIFNELNIYYNKKWKTDIIYNKACPDICAGEIGLDNNNKFFFDSDKRSDMSFFYEVETPEENEKTIVIILESPHYDEYKDGETINPAKGMTGKNLADYFDLLINVVISTYSKTIIKGSKCRIILMNSIPFQCSLGKSVNNSNCQPVRDLIFDKIWELEDIKKDFIARLESYNPDVIFNFCTSGDMNLKNKVQERIKEYCSKNSKNVELYTGNHPSCWKTKNEEKPYLNIAKIEA